MDTTEGIIPTIKGNIHDEGNWVYERHHLLNHPSLSYSLSLLYTHSHTQYM